jgi:hypothetical protein
MKSKLLNDLSTYDYSDSYSRKFNLSQEELTPREVLLAFFNSPPKWIEVLFELRNKIVSLFGLKVSNGIDQKEELLKNFKCVPGEQMGLFKVFDVTPQEVLLGEDDKHLNFRVSFLIEKLGEEEFQLTLITVVNFNNFFGKLYFFPVKPFHKIIVPTMLKGIVRVLKVVK